MWRTAEKRFVRHVCLRNPFPPFLFGIPSIQSLPEVWGSWEQKNVPSALRYSWIMPSPSLQLQKKTCVAQRSNLKGLATELWSPRCVTQLQYSDCALGCSMWLLETNEQLIVEIELLAAVGWKFGGQPFSCPHSQNVTHCRKQICSTCLSKESIPAIPFWNSKHPIPTRSLRFLRAAASSELWLHHAHAFVAGEGKHLSHAEKQRVWSRSCGLQDLLQCGDCALSCAMRLLQTNEHLSRWSF